MKKVKIILVSLACLLLICCVGYFSSWQYAEIIDIESQHGAMYRSQFREVKYQKTKNGIIIRDSEGRIYEFINSNIKITKKSGQK